MQLRSEATLRPHIIHDAGTCNVSGAHAVDRQLLASCQQCSRLHVALLPLQTMVCQQLVGYACMLTHAVERTDESCDEYFCCWVCCKIACATLIAAAASWSSGLSSKAFLRRHSAGCTQQQHCLQWQLIHAETLLLWTLRRYSSFLTQDLNGSKRSSTHLYASIEAL